MSIDRYGIHIGILFIHFYGVILMIGVLVAAYVASLRAREMREDPEHIWDMLTWVVIAGVIGARIWHILTPPASMVEQGITAHYYLTHPLDAIAIWKGGLGIPGAVAGGALAVYLYTRAKKLNFGMWMDFIAPGLALAQAIGRIGNFINQELYGLPTDLPWGIYIEPAYRVAPYLDNVYFHPLFLYESLWNLLNMALLIWISRRFIGMLKPGDIFLSYLVIYPIGRFFLEYLRVDYSPIGPFNINQLLMALITVLALAAILWRHRQELDKKSQTKVTSESDKNAA
jgi:phosphatidylglycerol:prolipoprotein diacylglycerol transferase